MIDGILTAAVTCAAAAKARREETALRQLKWDEEARERKEHERIIRLEKKRREFLDRQIKIFERAQQVNAFVNFYDSAHPPEACPLSCRKFLDWARGYVDLLNGRIAPGQLSEVLDEHNLMDDGTDISSWIEFN